MGSFDEKNTISQIIMNEGIIFRIIYDFVKAGVHFHDESRFNKRGVFKLKSNFACVESSLRVILTNQFM